MARTARTAAAKKWRPASDAWARAFAELTAGLGQARKMFGYPCAFVNGNMFCGLHEAGLIVRLPESERAQFLKLAGAQAFEPMPGRVMREYVVAPASMVNDRDALRAWVRSAFAYAASLPAKASRQAARTVPRRG